MTNEFFPKTCQWVGSNTKTGAWIECNRPWTDILEPELEVYCKYHYDIIIKQRKKHNEHLQRLSEQ